MLPAVCFFVCFGNVKISLPLYIRLCNMATAFILLTKNIFLIETVALILLLADGGSRFYKSKELCNLHENNTIRH